MNLGAAVFGLFCLVVVFAGIVFVVSVNAQQAPYTDTFGNTLSSTSNQSQNLVGNVTSNQGVQTSLPLIIIVGVIVVCMIIFAIYLASKVFLQ